MVRPHQGSLSGEAWFRAHVCVAADEAGKKKNRTRAGAGWQIFDLLKARNTFERDLGLNCLLLSQCISYRRKRRWGRLSEFGSPQARIQFWKGFRLLDQCVSHLSFRQLSWTRSLQEAPAFMIIRLKARRINFKAQVCSQLITAVPAVFRRKV